MKLYLILRIALRALRRNMLRSALTMLGIIIGVGAVITTIGVGNGAKAQVEAQIASLGQNVVMVMAGSGWAGGSRTGLGFAWTLNVGDAQAILQEVNGVTYVSPEASCPVQVMGSGLNWKTQASGEGPDYLEIRDWPLTDGAMFTEEDVRSVAKVCVIGQTIVDQLFPNTDPVGARLRMGNIPFKIVGVLAPKGLSVMGRDQDDIVLVPYTTFMKRVSKRTNLSAILVQVESAAVSKSAQASMTDLLRQRHKILPGHEDDFNIRGQDEIANAATATSKTLTILLGAIASVSLVVGGIGIMNIMLVSVTERTREIGIRMAVGAHGRHILLQFLIEAIILSCLGGGLGILVGIGSSLLLTNVVHWPVVISPSAILSAFTVSAAIGIFFGYYPARKAAALDPIEALRYE